MVLIIKAETAHPLLQPQFVSYRSFWSRIYQIAVGDMRMTWQDVTWPMALWKKQLQSLFHQGHPVSYFTFPFKILLYMLFLVPNLMYKASHFSVPTHGPVQACWKGMSQCLKVPTQSPGTFHSYLGRVSAPAGHPQYRLNTLCAQLDLPCDRYQKVLDTVLVLLCL